jgi:hypothetical protein
VLLDHRFLVARPGRLDERAADDSGHAWRHLDRDVAEEA